MKAHLLLVFASLALAAAKDYRPFYDQASPDRKPSPNVIGRSVAQKPQDGYYGDGDGEGGPGFEDGENRADVDAEDPGPEPTQTQGPSHDDPSEPGDDECTAGPSTPTTADSEAEECPGTEPIPAQDPSSEDTTVVPPTSTADAQAKDPPKSEPAGKQRSSYDGSPWRADEDITTLPPTSTADAEAIEPPESKSTPKSSSYEGLSGTKDELTTTITSTSTVTHFVTVPFPSSTSAAAPEPSPASSRVINVEEPVELAEIPPSTGDSGPISIIPLDAVSADSSIPHPTSPSSQSCRSLCEVGYPEGAGGRLLGSETPPIESRPPSWPTRASYGLATAGSGLATADSWNRTVTSASAPRKTPADDDEELSDGSAGRQDTPEATDAADAAQPPATGDYPEGPTTEGSPPPGWSPTTGAVATQTELAEGTSGTRRWVPDVLFAGGVFMLMALAGDL